MSDLNIGQLKDVKARLKSGEYDGVHIMRAWIAIDALIDSREIIASQKKEIKDFYELLIRDSENILKQAGQVKLLRELLTEVMQDECGAEQHLGETTCDRITLALADTTKG